MFGIGDGAGPQFVRVRIPAALDAALQRLFPSAQHGFAEWRAHQAILTLLRERGIAITGDMVAGVSKQSPGRPSPARTARRSSRRSGSRRRRR